MRVSGLTIFLWLVCYCAPLVDALNGYFIFDGIIREGGTGSPTQLYRLGLMLIMLVIIPKNSFIISFFIILYIIIVELISFLLHNNTSGFITGLVYGSKICYLVLLFFSIKELFVRFQQRYIIYHFRNTALIYTFILFFSVVLGVDKSTYAEGTFGTKGLFASGNGLSIYLGTLSLIALYYYNLTGKIKDLMFFVIILIGCLIIGAKTSMIFFGIGVCLLFYFSSYALKSLIFISTLAVFFIFLPQVLELFLKVFDVIVFRYEKNGFFEFLASSRDVYVIDAFRKFDTQGFNMIRVFFGSGIFASFRDFSSLNGEIYDTLETDLFDIFFAYGLFGVLLYFGFIFTGIIYCLKNKNITLFVAWISVCFFSILAGHVVLNGMSVIVFVLLHCLLQSQCKIKF